MNNRRFSKRASIIVAALVFGLVCLFTASSVSSLNVQAEWLVTAAAQARTQAGDCPVAGEICYELCFQSNPSGTFACYSNPPDAESDPGASIPSNA